MKRIFALAFMCAVVFTGLAGCAQGERADNIVRLSDDNPEIAPFREMIGLDGWEQRIITVADRAVIYFSADDAPGGEGDNAVIYRYDTEKDITYKLAEIQAPVFYARNIVHTGDRIFFHNGGSESADGLLKTTLYEINTGKNTVTELIREEGQCLYPNSVVMGKKILTLKAAREGDMCRYYIDSATIKKSGGVTEPQILFSEYFDNVSVSRVKIDAISQYGGYFYTFISEYTAEDETANQDGEAGRSPSRMYIRQYNDLGEHIRDIELSAEMLERLDSPPYFFRIYGEYGFLNIPDERLSPNGEKGMILEIRDGMAELKAELDKIYPEYYQNSTVREDFAFLFKAGSEEAGEIFRLDIRDRILHRLDISALTDGTGYPCIYTFTYSADGDALIRIGKPITTTGRLAVGENRYYYGNLFDFPAAESYFLPEVTETLFLG